MPLKTQGEETLDRINQTKRWVPLWLPSSFEQLWRDMDWTYENKHLNLLQWTGTRYSVILKIYEIQNKIMISFSALLKGSLF